MLRPLACTLSLLTLSCTVHTPRSLGGRVCSAPSRDPSVEYVADPSRINVPPVVPVVTARPPELQALLDVAIPVLHTPPLPVPPAQGTPWEPPPGADPGLVSLARMLFDELGAPDPRGCELRRVVLTVGEGPEPIEELTTAWWIPGGASEGREMVVGWDGLVHAAAALGPAVTVEEALPDAEAPYAARSVVADIILVRAGHVAPLRWPWIGASTADAAMLRALVAARAMSLAYREAAHAHFRGDDTLALLAVRRAVGLVPDAHGSPLDREFRDNGPDVEALAADLERRAARGPRAPVAADPDSEPTPTQVAAWVDELEDAGPDWPRSPVAVAMRRGGEVAVGPLINVMQDDTRLTRRPVVFAGMMRPLVVQPVAELARDLLRDLLPHAAPHEPAALAAYWAHAHTLTPAERYYELLVEHPSDHGTRAWLTCEEQPDMTPEEYWAFDLGAGHPRGESQRGRTSPSITEILSREILSADQSDCSVARALIAWEPTEAALPALRHFSQICAGARGGCRCDGIVTTARAQRGDDDALREWARRLVEQRPQPGTYLAERLAPGWLWPRRADVQAAIENLASHWPASIRSLPWVDDAPFLGIPALRRWYVARLADTSATTDPRTGRPTRACDAFAALLAPSLASAARACGDDAIDFDSGAYRPQRDEAIRAMQSLIESWPDGLASMPHAPEAASAFYHLRPECAFDR